MPKVRIEDFEDIEEIDDFELGDESVESGIEKFNRMKKTKMKNDENKYKNKKQNKVKRGGVRESEDEPFKGE